MDRQTFRYTTDIQAYFIQEFLATVNVVFRQQSSVS